MLQIKVIRVLIKIENLFCIYRNFCCSENTSKVLILLQIFIQLSIFVATLIKNSILIAKLTTQELAINASNSNGIILFVTFYILKFSSGLFFMIFGVWYSSQYKTFVKHLMTVHRVYKGTPTYDTNLRRLELISVPSVIVLVFIRLLLASLKFLDKMLYLPTEYYSKFILFFSEAWIDILYVVEIFVLHTHILMIYYLQRCLNSAISNVQESFIRVDRHLYEHRQVVQARHEQLVTAEQVRRWTAIHTLLLCCSQLISLCFKHQVSTSYRHILY